MVSKAMAKGKLRNISILIKGGGMVVEPLRPARGGFLSPSGCGWWGSAKEV